MWLYGTVIHKSDVLTQKSFPTYTIIFYILALFSVPLPGQFPVSFNGELPYEKKKPEK